MGSGSHKSAHMCFSDDDLLKEDVPGVSAFSKVKVSTRMILFLDRQEWANRADQTALQER